MGKRSDFVRKERDYYPTPYEAVEPLFPHLEPNTLFDEPCAGDYRLCEHLMRNGHRPLVATDVEPQDRRVHTRDAFDVEAYLNVVITNPPWDRKILHPMIELFRKNSCWLLFDADWMHTKQSAELMKYCEKVVSIGRVKWFDNKAGKDNACWYKFVNHETTTTFYGR